MRLAIKALGLVAALLPASSFASVYVGASGLGAYRPEYKNVDTSFGGKLYFGYRFDDLPIALEASYLDTGRADVWDEETYGDGRMRFRGETLGASYLWDLSPLGSVLFARGALYHGDTKVKFDTISGSKSSTGASLAFGGIWKINERFGLRFEYEHLFAAKDLDDNADIGAASVGLLFEFGHRGRASSVQAANADRAAVAPVAEHDEVAPAPVFMSPVAAQQQHALRASQQLEMTIRPRLGAALVVTIPSGAEYQRLEGVHNDEGSWGFVQYDRYRGWLFEGYASR